MRIEEAKDVLSKMQGDRGLVAVCVDDSGNFIFPHRDLYEAKWRGLISDAKSKTSTKLGTNILVQVPNGVNVVFLCVKTQSEAGMVLSYKGLSSSLLWLKQSALAFSPDDFRIDLKMNVPNYNWKNVNFLLDAHFRHLNLQVFSHQG